MKKVTRYIYSSVKKGISFISRYVVFIFTFRTFSRLSRINRRFSVAWEERYPCLDDNTITTGYDRHYVLHTGWAARILADELPVKHIDISSSLYFCSIASAFVSIEFFDYRPADIALSNLNTNAGDLLQLPFKDAAIQSLSCMHVVEHVGLGRYGDQLDVDGDLKAIAELKRVLAKNGSLLFVVPVGRPRVMFNAHRIYSYDQVIEYFEDLKLIEFALIPDSEKDGCLIRHANPGMVEGQNYGCGCFWFKK